MQIARSLMIRSEPEVVFRWIEEGELASQWQPDVAEYMITGPVVDVVGTEFRELCGAPPALRRWLAQLRALAESRTFGPR